MSSSDAATRRAALGRLTALAGGLALAGCNLRPVHAPAVEPAVNPALAAIAVEEASGRRDFVLRDYLLDELNPAGLAVPQLYTLQFALERELNALAIQLNDEITRYNLILAARFELRRDVDSQPLYRSAVRRVASYNVRRDPFATLVAQQDAERRAARELARAIRTMLTLYFADQAT